MTAPRNFKYLPPRVADQIRGLGLNSRRPMIGTMQGKHRSPAFGASVEFAEYRNYMPGDAPNLIDWSVLAKTDKYMIRRYQDETNLRACVLVDCSASLNYKHLGESTKFDYACSLAAGFMYLLVSQSDSARLVFFNDELREQYSVVSSVEGLSPILYEMEKVEPTKRGNIENSLHQAAELLTRRSLVIIISDLLQPPEEVARAIQHLQHARHEVEVYHIMDGALGGFVGFGVTGHGRMGCMRYDWIVGPNIGQICLETLRSHLNCIDAS